MYFDKQQNDVAEICPIFFLQHLNRFSSSYSTLHIADLVRARLGKITLSRPHTYIAYYRVVRSCVYIVLSRSVEALL